MPTLAELFKERNQHSGTITALQEKVEGIDQQILQLTQDRVQQMFALSGKQHGTVSVAGEDGIVIKGVVGKKVEWDSRALMAVAAGMPWGTVQRVFDIAFKVPEKAYAKLSEEFSADVVTAIEGARTTKYAPLKVTLEVKA